MKQFEINHTDLCEHTTNPQIYIPFTNEILDLGSSKLFATKLPGEDYFSMEDDFDFYKFLEEVPYLKDKKYKKEIKEYKEDEAEDSFYDYLYYADLLDTYFYYYLETFDINIVEIEIVYTNFNCGGFYEEGVFFFVKDEDKKISKLTTKQFDKKIIERISK